MADKRWTGYDPQLRQVPAVNGTRVNGGRKPRTRTKALSDCVSIFPDGRRETFKATRNPRKLRPRTIEVRDTRPDVLKYQSIVGNIGNVE